MAESLNKNGNIGWIAMAGIFGVIIVVSGVTRLQRRGQEVTLSKPVTERYESVAYRDKVRGAGPTLVSAALRDPAEANAPAESAMERKMVRNSSVDMVVRKPAEAAEKIRALVEGMGGFLMSSEVSGGQDATGAV